jgi:hypothetical protein
MSEVEEYQASSLADVKKQILPDTEMSVLDQLQRYQHVTRRILPYLDVYEGATFLQIFDRTIGWRKHAAAFSSDALYAGDSMYGGLGRTMDRSRMMKALRSLENKGLIARYKQEHSRVRIFAIYLDVDLEALRTEAPAIRKSVLPAKQRRARWVSPGDSVVRVTDPHIAEGDIDISQNDTGEEYRENNIFYSNLENHRHPELSAPGARYQVELDQKLGSKGVRPDIKARPRPRRPS